MAEVLECTTERVKELDESLTVLDYDGRKWLIGVQVAAALNRETFNMYRSMKVKNIDLTRAAPAHVEWLIRQGVVKGGTHSVTLIPYEAGLAFIQSVISSGGLTLPPRKVKKSSSSSRLAEVSSKPAEAINKPTDPISKNAEASSKSAEGGSKRPREPVVIMQQFTPAPPDRLAAAVATTRMRSAVSSAGGGSSVGHLSFDEDDEDSDDFSDDVVQPTKRRRTAAASRSSARRPSPRRTRSNESPLAARSPSYNLSSMPRIQTSFANARFMPTQATIPTIPDEEEDRPTRRARRWPTTSSLARKEAPKDADKPAVPRRPLCVSRRKQAPWRVMRAIQKEDCAPFKFRKKPAEADDNGADDEPAAMLHSLMLAFA